MFFPEPVESSLTQPAIHLHVSLQAGQQCPHHRLALGLDHMGWNQYPLDHAVRLEVPTYYHRLSPPGYQEGVSCAHQLGITGVATPPHIHRGTRNLVELPRRDGESNPGPFDSAPETLPLDQATTAFQNIISPSNSRDNSFKGKKDFENP